MIVKCFATIGGIMLPYMFRLRTIKWSETLLKAVVRMVSVLLFALGWQLLANALDILLLPSLTETASALLRLSVSRRLWGAVWVSNRAMILGFSLAAGVGIPLGLLIGRWPRAERYFNPYLNILLVTPKSALIPTIIMVAGLSTVSRVLVVFISAVVVITITVRSGLRTIDPSWVEMARSFGATEAQLWRRVLLPGALPAILTGLRLGLARSISGMITAELLLMALGIGRLMLEYQAGFDAAGLYATMVVVVAEAVALLQATRWLEGRLVHWAGDGVAQ